jgi:hypothetical protein
LATGNTTVTYGVLAPDGTYTAATIGSTSGAITLTLGSATITPAVGDWVIMGCYLWNPHSRAGGAVVNAAPFQVVWSNTSTLFDPQRSAGLAGKMTVGSGNPPNANGVLACWASNSWVPRCEAARIYSTPGGSQRLNVQVVISGSTHAVNLWHPFVYYIPAGTITDDDVIRLMQSLRRGPIAANAGDVAMLDHHKLMLGGGARLDSRSAQPVKLLYFVGDRTFDLTAATAGWTCTTAGGAFQGTRANTTAYTVGQWLAWTTGTTVVECTVAGTTAGSPPTAPTTVGQVVVDGGVTWVCRSLTKAVFRTGL